jgi:DNA-binding Lrp family transcriptional regulator
VTSAHSNLLTKWLFFDRINTTPGLMPSTYRVIARLLAHHNTETEECFPSESTIAKALGISVRQVKYCIEELGEKGWIKVTRRYNDSNQYEFCWERAGVTMKEWTEIETEKQEQESKQDGKQDIERVVEILSASRTKEDFERLYAEYAAHLNGELGRHMKVACEDVEDHHVKRFVEDLITAYPKSRKKHGLYRRVLPKIVRGLRPMRGTLEAGLGRLLEKTEGGFIPEFGDVKKAIQLEQGRLVTLATRCADIMSNTHPEPPTTTLN